MAPPIIVKSYPGRRQNEAAEAFMKDANWAGDEGYRPISQSWAEGGRTSAASLCLFLGVTCLVLGLFFIPLWLFAFVFIVVGVVSGKGPGLLTVTYQRPDNPDPTDVPPAAPANAPGDHVGALEQLTTMRDRGLITPADFETKKAELLGRL